MKIVQGDVLSEDARSSHRGGTVFYVRLLDGEPNSLDGFSLIVARTPGRFSPRHRHNFEQFRYQIDGVADYGRTGKLKPGMLGYFPEGVHYGPQTQEEGDSLTSLVLQCGGASGGGYLGRDGEVTYAEELKRFGVFKDGVFHRNEGLPGKRNLDAFQAIWEHVNARPLVYPKARYDRPVLMHPDNFAWIASDAEPGVATKYLGAFTEAGTAAAFIRLAPGASHVAGGARDVYYVLRGRGTLEGESMRAMTAFHLEPGERARLSADEETEIVHLRLPDLARQFGHGDARQAVAAE